MIPVILTLVFVFGSMFGARLMDHFVTCEWENLCVKKGKAEYYLDENNKKCWRWKK